MCNCDHVTGRLCKFHTDGVCQKQKTILGIIVYCGKTALHKGSHHHEIPEFQLKSRENSNSVITWWE